MQWAYTPLLLASSEGHHETVEVLLKHKADVNITDKVSQGEDYERAPVWLGGHGPCVGV